MTKTNRFVMLGGMELSTLADRLKYALEQAQMNQSELAKKTGVKPQAIQYLCAGKAKKTKYATEIARVLGVSSDWLNAGQGPMRPGEKEGADSGLTMKERAMLGLYRELSREDQDRLRAIMSALASMDAGVKGDER